MIQATKFAVDPRWRLVFYNIFVQLILTSSESPAHSSPAIDDT